MACQVTWGNLGAAMDKVNQFKKEENMVRVITIAFALVFGVLLLSDLAHADGAAVYAKCKGCHGADGKGNKAIGAPAFGANVDKAIISGGKGKMPSYKGKLTDAEIDEVVSYIKTLK